MQAFQFHKWLKIQLRIISHVRGPQLSLKLPDIFETRLEGGVKGWETKSHDYRALVSLRVTCMKVGLSCCSEVRLVTLPWLRVSGYRDDCDYIFVLGHFPLCRLSNLTHNAFSFIYCIYLCYHAICLRVTKCKTQAIYISFFCRVWWWWL